jgi:hypothetical protein
MVANLGSIGLYLSFFDCGAVGVVSRRRGCAVMCNPLAPGGGGVGTDALVDTANLRV